VTFDGDDRIIRDKCDHCGDCAVVCPSGALTQPDA
jgi:ferredoxin